jgi:transposase
MKRHEISEKQWNRIKDKFPPEKSLKEAGLEKATGKCSTQSCIG